VIRDQKSIVRERTRGTPIAIARCPICRFVLFLLSIVASGANRVAFTVYWKRRSAITSATLFTTLFDLVARSVALGCLGKMDYCGAVIPLHGYQGARFFFAKFPRCRSGRGSLKQKSLSSRAGDYGAYKKS